MQLSESEARQRFASARVLRLATADEEGTPHLVPATFAVQGDVVAIAVDQKPKRHQNLRRLRNITANDHVSLLVDEYHDDWTRLWWVRADGSGRVLEDDKRNAPLDWLASKYPQYAETRPDGPVIEITVTRWSGWSYTTS
ncbi:TIGR03668 family PPOX class F420-dependent oxidoreductase [Streptomyces uncialis]|uniref:TIGR03668 family PPOX class F420-dependent oxidoreductase n=1 Tax=Streptomyces uncialis TaxID=1048205 RepID=UPI0037BDDA6B|nr:TIGR03668 family PPOX class F420-dependent oxidoreductase [Streptomyces uncialis]